MEIYDETLTVKEALAQFFQRFGIPEDAYTAKYFTLAIGKFPLHVPNIPSRVFVARLHDVQHVLTGYPANWRGEAEIGAWEIATGCDRYFVAWFLNGGAVFIGLLLWPRAVWGAWKRGRQSRTNLYHGFEYESILSLTVKELREKIGLAAPYGCTADPRSAHG